MIGKNPSFHSYLLCYPDGTPFYAGAGQRSRYRCKKRNLWAERIRNKITRAGHFVLYIIFEQFSAEDAFKHEKELIAQYGRRSLGTGILVNATDGGEGVTGRILAPGELERLGSLQRGKKWSLGDPRRAEISKRMKGHKLNQDNIEWKKNTSLRMVELNKSGLPNRAKKGKSLSAERKKQISESSRNITWSEERKLRQSNAITERNKKSKSKPQPEKTKQKSIENLTKARTTRWARYHANNNNPSSS